jgi:type I restriction enzyme S subunit
MSSISERSMSDQMRTYDRASSVVFLRTHEAFGGLSNMAGGFPLTVQGTRIYTSEALYQACRFPHLPEVQRLIIGQASPMTAKMKSKPYRKNSRTDWDRVRVKVMRWCLRVKLAQNWEKFSELLLRTGERPIVEESRKDDFWGAKPVDERTLVGMNVLGRLLMELREAVRSQGRQALELVQPPAISEFLLFGRQIQAMGAHDLPRQPASTPIARPTEGGSVQGQASLFRVPAAREVSPSSYMAVERGERHPLGHLKPHPTMKDSGVAWLSSIPTSWNVRRLRNVADMRVSNVDKHTQEGEVPVRLCNYVDVYKNDHIHPSMPFMRATAARDEVARFRLAPGDVLITKDSETWNDIGVPALVVESAGDLVSGYHLALLRPFTDCIVGAYLFRALQSTGVAYQFHVEANGVTRYGLSHAAIRSVWLPVPPLSEQASIVRLLDHADRRIRRYIRAKQKLIKLLEEQKQAIIHRSVTRGIDANVRLKPSGVEWLGDIPEHWAVSRSRRLFSERTELARPDDIQLSATQAYGVIPQSEFESRVGRKVVRISMHLNKRRHVEEGDFVISMRSFQGGLERAWASGAIRSSYVVLRPEPVVDVDYFSYVFKTRRYIGALQATADFIRDGQDLTFHNFRRVDLPLVPHDEQKAIGRFIGESVQAIDSNVSKLSREIALVREYRTRLIADVATGKLDVSDAAVRVMDEIEESEPPDEAEEEIGSKEADEGLEALAEEAEA